MPILTLAAAAMIASIANAVCTVYSAFYSFGSSCPRYVSYPRYIPYPRYYALPAPAFSVAPPIAPAVYWHITGYPAVDIITTYKLNYHDSVVKEVLHERKSICVEKKIYAAWYHGRRKTLEIECNGTKCNGMCSARI